MTHQETIDLCLKLIEHLDYCRWGDSWERECSKELRKEVQDFYAALVAKESK